MMSMYKIGETLPNGATVIDCTETETQGVILAVTNGHIPFVSWLYTPGKTLKFLGSYSRDLTEGFAEYRGRVAKLR